MLQNFREDILGQNAAQIEVGLVSRECQGLAIKCFVALCLLYHSSSYSLGNLKEHGIEKPSAEQRQPLPRSVDSNDACSFMSLTSHCKIFDVGAGAFIPLANGQTIPNYAYLNAPAFNKSAKEIKKAVESHRVEERKLYFDFLKTAQNLLDKLAGKSFRNFLETSLAEEMWSQVFLPPEVSEERPIIIPWLVEQSGARLQRVRLLEVRGRLQALMGTDGFETLRKKYEAYRTAAAKREVAVDSPEIQTLLDVSEGQRNKAERLFEDAKRNIEKYLQSYVPQPNREHLKALVQRVRSAKLKQGKMFCGPEPILNLSPTDGEIIACPAFYHFPEEAIYFHLSESLARLVGPCISQWNLYELDANKVTKEQQTSQYYKVFFKPLTSDGHKTRLLPPVHISDGAEATSFIESGAIKLLQEGIPAKEFPFNHVLGCLNKPENGGFRRFNVEEFRSDIRASIEEKLQGIVGEEARAKVRKEYEEILRRAESLPECSHFNPGSNSEMESAFASWLGSEVTAEFIAHRYQSKPELNKQAALSLISMQASTDCREYLRQKDKHPDFGAIAGGYVVSQGQRKLFSADRTNNVVLRNPRIREALKCQGKKTFCK
ncbi:MAG: hypothetical protein HY537_15520 [Deltaproteobacteria bacterium]|nr:hypothetical protein [Deltaproteobacteria bacterium]